MRKRSTDYQWYPSPVSDFMQQAIIPVSDEIELCVEVGGNPNNPPLLLIMGLGSQLIFWPDSLLKRLIDAGFYIIRYDNRDIGLSTKIKRDDLPRVNTLSAMFKLQFGLDNSQTPVPYRLTDMADDAAHLIQALGLSQVHVLGASMGGIIAQILSAKYPHLINRLALIFSTNNKPLLAPPRPKQLYTLIKRPDSHAEEDIVNHGKWFIKTVGSKGHINEQAVADIARLRYQRCFYPAGTLQQLTAILMTGSIQPYSKEVKAPTLVMHGSNDGLLPPSHGKAVASDIPNAKFKLIKGMSHDLPEYFQPFIVSQLKRHMLQI
ncbi:alpha/beta hydrolase [Psychrobacter sp. YP14]|uniref:Alpha/beta fold hydrolase n=3 Tax=Psychrobacter TaxID=497 RepID=A0A844M2U5_9GAMM|nr:MULTISPECIES: alpha/beta hydrolase [Psychrobacter]AWT49145.1 alpha/beta hydrolase [Psychrobacter sp. YP14]MUG33292.1 alpha/beta fold hydrolase [Psychrobacter sanguinis]